MAYIPPLELETWFVNVLSGTPDIFVIVSLLVLSGMAGYFRMRNMVFFFMVGIFLLMFQPFVGTSPLLTLLIILGGLCIGIAMSRIIER